MKTTLRKSLIVKTRPQARSENIVSWGKYRVSVLTDRLFRIERSENGVFRDGATQTVWYRDMDKQKYTFTEKADCAIIETAACRLILKEEREDCFVETDGTRLPIENEGNLLGTYRTLDGCIGDWQILGNANAPVPLGNGVCSRSGVAVLDDSASLTLAKNGEIIAEKADGSDEYIFVYGDDYRGAVKALYLITGATPLVPRFALGNWWSRYHAYTQDEYIRLMNAFEEKEIPLTVATVDMDWHYSKSVDEEFSVTASGKNTEYYCGMDKHGGLGWTGYTWNKRLFYDYKKFLKDLKDKGLQVTLNLHPAQGVRYWEDGYEAMAVALGKDSALKECIPFDIANPQFINAYFEILHKPYEESGVDFWWLDWQQGTQSSTAGLDPLWSLNHYHYYDNADGHFSPMILSRYSGVGAHRYPLGFSGDTHIAWETLEYLPYFTATATNIGYTWWSHDIGGHHCGKKDDELFVRMLQYGVFSPINRLHGTSSPVISKEPWLYQNGAGHIVAEWLRFRHKLIPYLYSASRRTHTDGLALVEPLYYEWNTSKAYEYKTQYLFGGQLLVIPIATPAEKDGYARVRAWLPAGEWTDIFTGDKYLSPDGGIERTLLRTLEQIPVLARAGGILPLSRDKGNSVQNPQKLDICVWSGKGKFCLFEDGRTDGSEVEFVTEFTANLNETEGVCTQSLKISSHGERDVIPQNRTLRVLFKDIAWQSEAEVYRNGERLNIAKCLTECACIEFPYDTAEEYEVRVRFQKPTRLEYLKARVTEILLRGEAPNGIKGGAHTKLQAVRTVNEFVSTVTSGDLPDCIKRRLLESV